MVGQGPTLRHKFIWTSYQTRDGDQPYAKWSQRRRPPFYGAFQKCRCVSWSNAVDATNEMFSNKKFPGV